MGKIALQARKMQEQGWKPQWFAKDKETDTYRFRGGYWEAREHHNWDSCPDIFGQLSSHHWLTTPFILLHFIFQRDASFFYFFYSLSPLPLLCLLLYSYSVWNLLIPAATFAIFSKLKCLMACKLNLLLLLWHKKSLSLLCAPWQK